MTDTHVFDGSKQTRRQCYVDATGLLVLWLFMLACTMPAGNFPLNDDWNYAVSVKALLEEHRLIVTHWSLAASLPHILLGWLATSISGFSFAALRAVPMIAGYISALLIYFIARKAEAQRFYALLAAAVWMTNPLLFNLSTTYMTDVTFMMLAGATIACCASMLTRADTPWRGIVVTSALAILTSLTRQTGLVIPIAFLLAKKFAPKAWLPPLLSIAAVIAFQFWLNGTIGELQSYRVEHEWIRQLLARGPLYVMSNSMSNLISSFIYLGLFLAPILLVAYPALLSVITGKERRSALIMFAEPAILFAVGLIMTRSIMPLSDNVLFNLGLGPVLLGGEGKQHYAVASNWFWMVVTICGVTGAGAIISLLVTLIGRLPAKTVQRPDLYAFLLWTFLLYLCVICFRGFFDRYLIFPLFLLLPIVASFSPLPTPQTTVLKPLSALFIVLFGTFSVAGTHDYFAWNQARWQAAHDLVDVQNISPMEIDGGLEFNGWYGYDPKYRNAGGITLASDMRHEGEYEITMQQKPGFEVLSRYTFQRWLPWGSGEIVVLHRLH